MHNLVIIGGNPGSGKTTISQFLETRGFIPLKIDQFYHSAPRDPNIPNWFEDREYIRTAYEGLKAAIFEHAKHQQPIVVETTGVSKQWQAILAELQAAYPNQVITIYLSTTRDTSWKRINARNTTDYPLKMTEERLDVFLELGKDTSKGYQHVIDANKPIEEVLEEVLTVIG